MSDFEKPGYWAVIPAGVRYDEQIPPNAKLLYAEISSLTQADGYCWSTNEYFQKVFGFSDRSIRRLLAILADAKYIRIEDGSGKKRKIYAGINPLHGQDANPDKIGRVGDSEPGQNCPGIPAKIVRVEQKHIINKNNKMNNKKDGVENASNDGAALWRQERFDGLWKYYPHDKRGNKQRAMKAWEKLHPDDETIDGIARGLKYLLGTEEWLRGVGIPNVSTFLNNAYWEDALERMREEDDDAGGWLPDPEVMHHD